MTKPSQNPPVYVLGGGINALAVVRNLGRHGVLVNWVVERKKEAFHSRYCREIIEVPQIEKDIHALIGFLDDPVRRRTKAVLFPASDFHTLHLSALRDELQYDYGLPSPSYQAATTLIDKRAFYKSLLDLNIPHPATYFPDTSVDIVELSKRLQYPVFIKPAKSHEFALKFASKGFIAKSGNELVQYYQLAFDNKVDVIIQEIIPGLAANNIFGVEGYFNKHSELNAVFTYCRLRGWEPVFGNTCLRESIDSTKISQLIDTTTDYLQQIHFNGLMEAEWKKDPRDGCFKLLEINARQSMQSTLPARCGINLVLIAYLDAAGYPTAFMSNYRSGLKWIDFSSDIRSTWQTNVSLLEWIKSLKGVREWAYFAADDLSPFFENNIRKFGRFSPF